MVNAKQEPIAKGAALELARAARKLLAAKGKQFVEVDLQKADISDDELARLIVGPSGKLRAPAFRIKHMLVVGFNEAMYEQVFNG